MRPPGAGSRTRTLRAVKKTPGIVMIDELDLHFHPRWQRHVLADLCRTFPEVQFIATTHSPQLISEVQPESLIVLTHDPSGKSISVNGTQSYGLDANWVLEHIMGAPARPDQKLQRSCRTQPFATIIT